MRAIYFLILSFTLVCDTVSGKSALTEREAREFMGLYSFNLRRSITENGYTVYSSVTVRDRVSWKGDSGNGVVNFEGGYLRPENSDFKAGRRFMRFRTTLGGLAVDPGVGLVDVSGFSELTLRKKGRRQFQATSYQRIAIGSAALIITQGKGKKIR